MAIPASFKDELIARSDILDIVSDYVTLTPKGGSYWGLCPFHGEKTPSFHVLPDRQLYHCFGCGKGGGVISFIMVSWPNAQGWSSRKGTWMRATAASVPAC